MNTLRRFVDEGGLIAVGVVVWVVMGTVMVVKTHREGQRDAEEFKQKCLERGGDTVYDGRQLQCLGAKQ